LRRYRWVQVDTPDGPIDVDEVGLVLERPVAAAAAAAAP
jgi:hypothetical protein